jgi:preprotein translocase subunit SecG
LKTYFYIIQVIISVALIAIILLQSKGSGGLGGLFGGSDGSVYKSRRGFEKTIYHMTIGLSVAFFLISLMSVIVTG